MNAEALIVKTGAASDVTSTVTSMILDATENDDTSDPDYFNNVSTSWVTSIGFSEAQK